MEPNRKGYRYNRKYEPYNNFKAGSPVQEQDPLGAYSNSVDSTKQAQQTQQDKAYNELKPGHFSPYPHQVPELFTKEPPPLHQTMHEPSEHEMYKLGSPQIPRSKTRMNARSEHDDRYSEYSPNENQPGQAQNIDLYKQHNQYDLNYDQNIESNYNLSVNSIPKKKPQVLEFFGIYSSIPTLTILKLFAFLVLIAMVETSIFSNLFSDRFLGDLFSPNAGPLYGISSIGMFLGFLVRYLEFESQRLKWFRLNQQKSDLKSYLTIIFLAILFIFIIIEVISELLFARGALFLIDLLGILCMTFGTYTILSAKRYMNVLTFIFLFLILIVGTDFKPDIPIMVFTSILIILFLELSDGICRLQGYIAKYHDMTDESKPRTLVSVDLHLDRFSIQFVQQLGIFVIFTILVTGIMLAVYYVYPYITPNFINQNLELQSIYSILPIIALLFFIFIIIYMFTSHLRPSNNLMKDSEK